MSLVARYKRNVHPIQSRAVRLHDWLGGWSPFTTIGVRVESDTVNYCRFACRVPFFPLVHAATIAAYAALCVELIIRGTDSNIASAFIALAAG